CTNSSSIVLTAIVSTPAWGGGPRLAKGTLSLGELPVVEQPQAKMASFTPPIHQHATVEDPTSFAADVAPCHRFQPRRRTWTVAFGWARGCAGRRPARHRWRLVRLER